MASTAVTMAMAAVFGAQGAEFNLTQELRPKRRQCHVVILVPGMPDHREEEYPDWPDYPTGAKLLYQESYGTPEEFEHDFVGIAQCKALQLWTGRANGGTDILPHLLFPGDTPYWGGAAREGIVVACSGVQPWIDRLIANLVIDILVAMAYGDWMESDDKKNQVSFIT